jgi:TRAP-type C4-dicarboxylate transport system substrate-binding protein
MIRKLLGVLTVFIMLTGAAFAADPAVLKMATFEPPQSLVIARIYRPLVEEFNKAAKGVLKIELYTGGTLGRDPMTYLKKVNDGTIDLGWIMNSYHPGRFMDDMVCHFPFIAKNVRESSLGIYSMHQKGMLRGYDDLYVAALVTSNQMSFHTTFPIKSPDDLKGKKIRSSGKIQHNLITALGATPVAIPITKTTESLSRGVIQGAVTEPVAVRIFRIDDIAKYHTFIPLGCVTLMYAMSKKKYESLSSEARALLDKNTGEPWTRRWGERNTQITKEFIKEWEQNPKHTVYLPSFNEMEQWKAKFAPVIESFKKENPKGEDLLKAYAAEIAKIRAEK